MEAVKGETQAITFPMLTDNNNDVQHGKVSLEVQEWHMVTNSCILGLKDHTAEGSHAWHWKTSQWSGAWEVMVSGSYCPFTKPV